MSSEDSRSLIIGPEAVPGDAATPTVMLLAKGSLERVVDKISPDQDSGSFAPTPAYIGSAMGKGKIEMSSGYFEHAPYMLSMAMGAGVKTGVADPYTYTYALPHATAPTFKTYRVETGDGADHIVSMNDGFAVSLEIKGEAGKGISITNDLTGGLTTYPAALGAVLSALASPTFMRMADTVLTMDDLFANIGTTTMPMLISFSWKLEELQHSKQFGGGLYPTGRGNGAWKISLELIAEIQQAKINTEKAKDGTTALTAIRIQTTENANDVLTLGGMYELLKVAPLDARNRNNIVKLTYNGVKDTLGSLPSVVVKTNLAAY